MGDEDDRMRKFHAAVEDDVDKENQQPATYGTLTKQVLHSLLILLGPMGFKDQTVTSGD